MTIHETTTQEQTQKVWKKKPDEQGLYLVYERGRGLDTLYWSGDDDPVFAIFTEKAFYHGPLPKLPFAV